MIPIKFVPEPNIGRFFRVIKIDHEPSWMDEIIEYICDDKLPEGRDDARIVKY